MEFRISSSSCSSRTLHCRRYGVSLAGEMVRHNSYRLHCTFSHSASTSLRNAHLSVIMYSHGSESLIKQAREIQDSELQKFYSRLVKLLQGKELGHETVDSLQRLHLILSANKYIRTASEEASVAPLLPSEQFQVLSSAVLRETLPPAAHSGNYSQENIVQLNSHAAALLLSQAGSRADVSSLCSQLLRGLESHHVTLLSKKLVDWLRYASILQGGGASSGGFFTGPRSRQSFTEDQWMNVFSFSALRHWLLTYHSVSNGNGTADTAHRLQLSLSLSHSHSFSNDDRSEVDGSVVSMVSATSSSSRLLPPKERLREKSFQYCQRLIEQSDRKAHKKSDADLQKACLVEAVCILDCVCEEDASLVFRAFPCIKALFGRLSSDLSFARVLLPIAQFYLNHGEIAAVDCGLVWALVFGRFPAELFNDPFLAHELLRFLRLNLESLQLRVPQYTHSFPNLLKFLAWDSPAVVDDFVDLLPSLVTAGTAVELLHTLLDLPCLSATLVLQVRSTCLPISEQSGRGLLSLDAFRSPSFRGLFLFLLRGEAGSGDTIDRLSTLHELLVETADWPRVVQCAQTVPVLLHIFFNTVITVADEKLLAHLILVMLERSSLLLNIPKYNKEIHRVFSSHLLRLCKLHPSLVWVLGEYLSVSCDSRCSVTLITACFEALEAVLFEITSSAPPPGADCPAPRVVTTLMSALAKLASRSHDLIPRGGSVAWCSDEEDLVAIVTRGEELWSLLKAPGVAQSVLTPPAH
ncbi:hypothetical protein F7725_003795, partial [Dissostichus mawsoni]